ncbi:MAG: adenosylmethionine--8-amino-7-oxononanoate transaminase [Saprospiraceae bacterium]
MKVSAETSQSELLEKDRRFVWHPYTQMLSAPPPLPIVRGTGALLVDDQGNTYIDAVSSWWVNIHGHSHPYIAKKIAQQATTLEHVIFAGFTHPPAVALAERLIDHLPDPLSKVFYSDNGSTAVEIAIKMAIQYYHNRDQPKKKLIALDQAFHGETFGAMSASGDLSLNNAFKNQLFEVARIPAPLKGKEAESEKVLEQLLQEGDAYAFIFEPLIMGAGGMLMYEPAILDKLIRLCQKHGVLTIADEVMTGFGRTGQLFAIQHLATCPDLICLAKGLTGGVLPLAVTCCTDKIYEAFLSEDKGKTFFHGHSFTANPLGCAAALASLDLLEGAECQENISRVVRRQRAFREKMEGHAAVKDIRQTGTILALEFNSPEKTSYFNQLRDQLYQFFLDRRILLRPLGNVIYFMPPYCISDKEMTEVYQAIEDALVHFNL